MSKNIHPYETEQLAAHICGLDYDAIDADTSIIESAIYGKYGIYLEQFHDMINDLATLIQVAKSPLTEKIYKGFAKEHQWLVKIEVE